MTRTTDLARVLSVFLLVTLVPDAPAAAEEAVSPVGVWAGVRDFGPVIRGPLFLHHRDGEWTADIAGRRVTASSDGDTVTFEVPGGLGAFRGSFDDATDRVSGQWIQPPVVSMFGQSFSTPVHLEATTEGVWRGEVRPLRDRVHLFLVVRKDDGTVRVFLRNPEVNFGRFFDFASIELDEGRVILEGTLAHRPETEVALEGTFDRGLDRITVTVDNLGGTYDLHRLDPREIPGFLPRAWARTPYRYRPPTQLEDGWETAELAAVGMATSPIEELVQEIVDTPIEAIDTPYVEAVLVARHGKLVVEEYFHGHHRHRPHDTRSASKSFTSTLVGAAIHTGLPISLETGVYDAIFAGSPPPDLDPRASRMTVGHLLTMTPGLACDDWDSSSPGNEDTMQSQEEQPDWYRYTLDLPMAHEPGEHAAYCSAAPNLAGGVLSRAVGAPFTEIFDTLIGRPMQFGPYHTNLMPTGEAYAGGGLRSTARDFLKLGQLMLDDGIWNGRRLLDTGWADSALTPRNEIGDEGYGVGWWLFDYELGGQRWDAFYAGGNGGQYVIGVPALDLAITFQASNYNQSVMHDTKYQAVPEYILRSILEGEANHDEGSGERGVLPIGPGTGAGVVKTPDRPR